MKILVRIVISILVVVTAAPGQSVRESIVNLNNDIARLKDQVGKLPAASSPTFDHVQFGPGFASFVAAGSNKQVAYIGATSLEDGLLQIFAKNGSQLAYLGASATSDGKLQIYARDGTSIAGIFRRDTSRSGYAEFYNDKGNAVAVIGAGTDGAGFGSAWFNDADGKLLIQIGSTIDGKQGGVWVGGEKRLDYAETFELATRAGLAPGSVMSASDDGGGLVLATSPYDPKVVGVISGAGGYQAAFQAGSRSDGTTDYPIALVGRVFVRVNCASGPIRVGDLLVASGRPGVAMRSVDTSRQTGAIIGKALRPLPDSACAASESLIEMLVMAR